MAAPTLVYLYGPPAAGKLTVATALQAMTGFRLFPNHLTVNALRPVFDFASPPFNEVLHRLRLDVFATAAAAGVDVIFTNSSAWPGPDARARFEAFTSTAADLVASAGGRVRFVQLTASAEVLAGRVGDGSRREHGKLLDRGRLAEMLSTLDARPLHDDDLRIDTGLVAPGAAARQIVADLATT